MRILISFILSISLFSCVSRNNKEQSSKKKESKHSTETAIVDHVAQEARVRLKVENGDLQLAEYLPLLKDKKVGLVVNQSSILGETHLIDTLLSSNVKVAKLFSPEHGIRGKADAGEAVTGGIDTKTGLPIISLYGNHKKPTPEDFVGIDIMVFDLQDVGVRFFTYISTMHYVMEACAENNIPVIILDRPNPNGDYIAGPILEAKYQSFIGMHPIPIVHGLTVGELALMINGERWLKDSLQANLTVIECKHYTHDSIIPLAVKPSPNLPTLNSIRWYPSICMFEETQVSVGRGTLYPFEVYGSPFLDSAKYKFSFTPVSIEGMSKTPPFQNKICYGKDFREQENHGEFKIDLLVHAFEDYKHTAPFFTSKNFTFKLCGTTRVVDAIEAGKSVREIKHMFDDELEIYQTMRTKYLLYKDFDGK